MTAKSIRSKFSTKSLHYQPELFSLKRCLELKTIDSIFGFRLSAIIYRMKMFQIILCRSRARKYGKKYSKFFKENKNSIFIPIATPGVNIMGISYDVMEQQLFL